MAITPDNKDWTRILDTPCDECGFDGAEADPHHVGAILRDAASTWEHILAPGEDVVRRRPNDEAWSKLEYACHVRDVCREFDTRLERMLAEDAPTFANWDQDAAAVAGRYSEQHPKTVAMELATDAHRLAGRFDSVGEHEWNRTGVRSNGSLLTVVSLALLTTHEIRHHLRDVGVSSRA